MIPTTGNAAVAGEQERERGECSDDRATLGDEPARREHIEPVLGLRPSLAHLLPDGHDHDQCTQDHRGPVVQAASADLGEEAAADLPEASRERCDRLALEQILGGAAEHQHSRQRHDEGRNADVSDPESLPRTDQRPQQQTQRHRHRPREVLADHQHRRHGSDESGDGPDRQIDVTGDDDDDHADGQDEDVTVLLHDVGDIERFEQDPVGPDLEQDHDQGERHHHAVLAEVAL